MMDMTKDYAYCVSKASYLELKAIGTVGRLICREQHIELDQLASILTRLEEVKRNYIKPPVVKASIATAPVSVQDRMVELARLHAAEFDGAIDDFAVYAESEFSAKTYLAVNEVSGPVAKKIGEFFKRTALELQEAYKGKNDDLNEGYGSFHRPHLRKFAAFVQQLVDDCMQQSVSAKAQRKPVTRKVKPASAIVKKMKYMREFVALKLRSIDPTKILGSSELWVYSPVKRKLTVYYAADDSGLGVSGMSVNNYDVAKSETKTLRKPEEFFKGLALGKRALASAWKAINAKVSSPRSRVNEEMILLAAN